MASSVSIILLLASTVFSELENEEIRGTSCVKVKGQLYLIGGEVNRNKNWEPMKTIYRKELTSKPNSGNGWSAIEVPNYKPPGPYITAASSSANNDLIYYYSGVFSTQQDIALKSFDIAKDETAVVEEGPISLTNEIEKSKLEYDVLFQHQNLVVNDVNPQQLILLGGNIKEESPINILTHYKSLSVFDIDKKTWHNIKSESLIESFRITAVYEGIIYVFGDGFDHSLVKNGHSIPYAERNEPKVLGAYKIKENFWTTKLSRGAVPIISMKYSYTQEGHRLYLAGHDVKKNGAIFVLDLKTLIWTSYNETNFMGYPNGCLTFHNNYLIHDFDDGNQKGTQLIDTFKWFPEDQVPGSMERDGADNKGSQSNSTLYIVLGSLAGVALLACIAFLFYRRRRSSRLSPPGIIADPIMCEDTTHSLDYDNSNLFQIDELKPEECFNKNDFQPHYNDELKGLMKENPNLLTSSDTKP